MHGAKSWMRDRVLRPLYVRGIGYLVMPSRFGVRAADGGSARFLQGWHDVDLAQGVVWSKREGWVVVSKPHYGKEIYLEAILPPAFDGGVNRLEVSCNGVGLGSIDNDTGSFHNFNATFNMEGIRESTLLLKFAVSRAFRPDGSGGESEGRELGFAFGRIQVRSGGWSFRDVVLADRLRLALLRAVVFPGARFRSVKLERGDGVEQPVPRNASWKPGVSVVVYACAGLSVVEKCLESVITAARRIDEPLDLIVVLKDSLTPPERESLRERFPDGRFIPSSRRAGIASDIRDGVDNAVHDWVYLLHAGMAPGPDALREILDWRAPHVFSVGSMPLFADGGSARDGNVRSLRQIIRDRLGVLDPPAEDPLMVRGGVYTDGRCALFRRALLQRLFPKENCYAVPEWAFIESGVRAWKNGYEVLFCPASIVQMHSVEPADPPLAPVEPGLADFRDLLRFELRNSPDHRISSPSALAEFACLDPQSRRSMIGPGNLLNLFRARLGMRAAPFENLSFRFILNKYYPSPFGSLQALPCVVFVSPYVIYPPTHGGAVRMHRIIEELCKDFRVVVLSDEESAYNSSSFKYFSPLNAVHLVGGRPPEEGAGNRIDRIRNHSHDVVRRELRRIIASYRPHIVQLEFVELAGMVEDKREGDPAWVIALHDVLLAESSGEWTDEDRYEKKLIDRFDAAITCSNEDAVLLDRGGVHIVPNGISLAEDSYVKSEGRTSIMFMGPFRYRPNLEGVRIFLQNVFPVLSNEFPELEIHLLCGNDARKLASGMDCFEDPRVHFVDYVENVRPWLDRCALTINPLYNIRGTSIKLLESVAAGRICVTTVDGARGYGDVSFPSLIKTPRIEDFLQVLERLLADEEYRLALEKPRYDELREYTWSHWGRIQADVYRRLME